MQLTVIFFIGDTADEQKAGTFDGVEPEAEFHEELVEALPVYVGQAERVVVVVHEPHEEPRGGV